MGRRIRWVFGMLLSGCASDQGFDLPVIDYGPPNPIELRSPSQIDRIVQTTVPLIDVMFVVDNSCSMEEEQNALGTNFPAMLDWFVGSGLDFHIGVISTDMKDPLQAGRLQPVGDLRWVQEDTEQPEAVFASMVSLGTSGDWEEKGRASAYTAIELLSDSANLGFVRPDAGMHITVVSDENDASGDSPITRDEWIDYLNHFRWSQRLVSFSSIVGPTVGCPDIGSPGTEYTAVTAAVGGVVWDICSGDWTAILDELGFVAVGLSREFFLSQRPVPGTLEVRVVSPDGTVRLFPASEWSYSAARNSVTFSDFVPDPLSVVELEYVLLSSINGADEIEDTPPAE